MTPASTRPIDKAFAAHQSVNDSAGEYVNCLRPTIHVNIVEGFFSVFKRGMKGTYQHCAEHHLNRNLAEFDFRYNRVALGVDDQQRAETLLMGVVGRRLTYQTVSQLGAGAKPPA